MGRSSDPRLHRAADSVGAPSRRQTLDVCPFLVLYGAREGWGRHDPAVHLVEALGDTVECRKGRMLCGGFDHFRPIGLAEDSKPEALAAARQSDCSCDSDHLGLGRGLGLGDLSPSMSDLRYYDLHPVEGFKRVGGRRTSPCADSQDWWGEKGTYSEPREVACGCSIGICDRA